MKATGQVGQPSGHHPDYLEITDAAKALDISPEALRKRIARGTIEAVKENGHWYVQTLDNHPDTSGQPSGQEMARAMLEARATSLEAQLALVEAKATSLEAQLEVKDTQIGELHRLMAQTALQAAPAKPWWKIW